MLLPHFRNIWLIKPLCDSIVNKDKAIVEEMVLLFSKRVKIFQQIVSFR